MRVLFLGPPGAGKGTQAVRLAERHGAAYIATGNILRDAVASETPLGLRAKPYMDRGEYVPDDLVIGLVADRIREPDADSFVLDGFPRTQPQAEALDRLLSKAGRPLDAALLFDVPTEEIVARAAGRRTCPECHRPYHFITNPPARDEMCDDDNTPLEIRPDDRPEVVRHRLDVYETQTAGLVDYYSAAGPLAVVDGIGGVDEVSERVEKALESALNGDGAKRRAGGQTE